MRKLIHVDDREVPRMQFLRVGLRGGPFPLEGSVAGRAGANPAANVRVRVSVVEEFAVPLHCRHCQDAPCIQVCPTHAMSRSGPDEPVVVQLGSLHRVYAVRARLPVRRAATWTEQGKAIVKCDLCVERMRDGAGTGVRDGLPHPGHSLRLGRRV